LRRTITLAIAGALVAALLAACSHDGRTLRPPAPGATAPPIPTTTTAPAAVNPPVGSNGSSGSSSASGTLVLTSPAFADGGTIPAKFSCHGENVSPPLQWTGVPADAVELAIAVVDPDAEGGFVHWVLANVDPTATGLDEGAFPEGAVEARNDTSEFGWFGPCPPAGPAHHYVFTLYALRSHTGLEPGVGGPEALQRLAETPADTDTLTGLFASGE